MERERIHETDLVDRVEPDIRVVTQRPTIPVEHEEHTEMPPVVTPRDRVRWGPIWAGLLTTITSFLVLELLAYGFGLLTVDLNPNAGGAGGAWVTGIIGLIAFFVGGWVTGATTAIRGTVAGLLNGFMVWALGTVLILAFSTLGLSRLFGAVGSIIAQFIALGNLNFLQNANVNPDQIAAIVRNGALWAAVSLIITAIAAAVGGLAGIKSGPIGKPLDIKRKR